MALSYYSNKSIFFKADENMENIYKILYRM